MLYIYDKRASDCTGVLTPALNLLGSGVGTERERERRGCEPSN